MNLNAKYDVFVSYSRKDYVDEAGNPLEGNAISRLLDFLDNNNVSYWFDKDGISGGSEFLEVITDAITDSKMMIFVSSTYSNASLWTTGEIFEALEQEKLIVPFKIDNSPYNKKYRLMVRPLDYIEYFANPEIAFDSLLKAINLCKEEYDKAVAEEVRREEEEKAKLRKVELLEEIRTESAEYLHHASMLSVDAQKIVDKQKLVGNKEKACPVCSTVLPIERTFCKKCGWTFNPVFDATPSGEKNHLFVMRSLWKVVQDADVVRVIHEKKAQEFEVIMKNKEHELETITRDKNDKIEALTLQLSKATSDYDSLTRSSSDSIVSLTEEMQHLQHQLDAALSEIEEKGKEIESLTKQFNDTQNSLEKVNTSLKAYQEKEERVRQAQLEAERKEAERIAKEERELKVREAEAHRKAEEKNKRGIFKVGNVEFKMIRVEGGSFTMGATPEVFDPWDSEKPIHKVSLGSYYIGETLVTQALWETVMGNNPSYCKGAYFPVERVSWDDCQEFIKKLNQITGKKFRLPTEAEWEYAARGGVNCSDTQYSGSNRLEDVAWYDGNSGGSTRPVKLKNSNELGLYDMTGNVWEWCQDWYGNYSPEPQTDPTGPDSGTHRVDRGGSKYNDKRGCRISFRGASSPNYRGDDLGLRLALSE